MTEDDIDEPCLSFVVGNPTSNPFVNSYGGKYNVFSMQTFLHQFPYPNLQFVLLNFRVEMAFTGPIRCICETWEVKTVFDG